MKANVYDEGRAPDMPQLNELGKPTPRKAKTPARSRLAEWLVIAGLLVLSVIPLAGGAFRLTQLTGGAEITPANARFFASPLPVVAAYRERQPVCHSGRFPVCIQFPAAQARLAPCGRAAPGPMWTAGWVFRSVDDPVLSPPGWRR